MLLGSSTAWEYFDLVLNEELSIDSPSMTIITPEDINEEIESANYFISMEAIQSIRLPTIHDNQVTSKEMILGWIVIQDVEEAQDEVLKMKELNMRTLIKSLLI